MVSWEAASFDPEPAASEKVLRAEEGLALEGTLEPPMLFGFPDSLSEASSSSPLKVMIASQRIAGSMKMYFHVSVHIAEARETLYDETQTYSLLTQSVPLQGCPKFLRKEGSGSGLLCSIRDDGDGHNL